ncbi:MAG: S-layer homology domain-containing protein, partial [Gorillibacterium sp.]|nr:S-layer homology domain-containing protein [Gorillibacterium sp.]
FNRDVIGVIGYNNGNFKVIPEFGQLPTITANTFQRETTTLEVNTEKLLIASYNIENYYPGVGATKIQKLAESITANMKKPDIIGVVEMQDSNGEANDATVEARATELIAAIVAAGGPSYQYTDIAPVNNMDGGAPGGNIRAGFLFNPARVQLATSTNGKGSATQSVGYNATTDQLTYNPGRIDPTNSAFNSSRKPLAAQFVFNGEKVIVIANHFNSKTGDTGPFGSVQPPLLSSEAQRHEIAAIVNDFTKEVLTANPKANIVALGDLNDFQFTETATILKGTQLDNLIDKLPLNERYTYTYDGNSQVLDNILVSKYLTASAQVDVVHLNADFSPANGRVSDHDAVMAQIDLKAPFTLRILHTNDTHSHLETATKRITAIKQERMGNSILVDAGDVFSGTLYFTKFEGLADLAFMNYIGYDAMTFGNHEFDKGLPTLRNFIDQAKFPLVSANIDFTSKDNELKGIYKDEIGGINTSILDGHIYPSIVTEAHGEKIGIFGLTTEDTVGLSSPGDKIAFKNYKTSAENTIQILQAQGVNKIIVLSHLGYNVDLQLAAQVSGIDVIVGGHTHTKLDAPVVINADSNRTLIVQTGEYGSFLGELDVSFDDSGVITQYNGKLLDVANFAEDALAKQMLVPYDNQLTEIRQTVVGQTDVDLVYDRLIDGKVTRVVRKEETNLGNLIADGIANEAKEQVTKLLSPEELSSIKGFVAIQNGGGIRIGINKGPITLGQVLTVMPFSNSLVALKVTGQEIIDSLENGVSGLESDQGRFAQVSGMRYTYDSTKQPEIINVATNEVTQVGKRMVSVDIKQANGAYSAIDPTAYYILSTNSFMAGGGDFYRALGAAKADGRYYDLYLPDFEVFTDYLNEVGSVNMSTEGRITDLKGTTPTVPTTPDNPSPNTPTVPTVPATPTVTPQQVTITASDLTKELAALPAGSNELVIPVTATAGGAQISLPGSVLVEQAAAHPDRTLTFTTTDGASYSLPVRIINGAMLATQLGTSDFTITVSIVVASTETLSSVKQAIASQQNSITLAAPVIEFSITAQAGKTSVSLNNFGETYVERSIHAPSSLNPQHATAVAFDPATGKLTFVPSVFVTKADGTTDVTIKRNSNSYYTVVQSTKTFGDITDHWAKSSIELLASKLIVSGTSNSNFSPSLSITRAEFAALMTRSLGLKTISGESTFSDVSSDKWYTGDIITASAAGLISGYTDGTFKPNNPITRQEMASVLAKCMKYTGKGLNADPAILSKFSDAASISAWAQSAVAEIAAEGIIQGTPDGFFAPNKLATRAEAVTMLEKTLKSLKFIN